MAFLMFPTYDSMHLHAQDQVISEQLLRAIHLAQMEAMVRRERVMLKKHPQGWQAGYVIATDTKILYVFSNVKNKGILHWRAFPIHRDNLQFIQTGSAYAENGTFWYCGYQEIKPRWAIMVNQAGRARIVYPNKEGNIESVNPLLC